MAKKRNALGRGLKALLDDAGTDFLTSKSLTEPDSDAAASMIEKKGSTTGPDSKVGYIENLPLDQIEVNPFQPRATFNKKKMQDLADSIKIHGVIQPITVRRLSNEKYQLIAGERRLRASQMSKITDIPAYIRLANDQEILEIALIENIQREDLNAIEIGINYKRLIEECSLTQDALAARMGKDRTTVTNYLRLLKLLPEIQLGIKENKITMGHARALISMENPIQQLKVYKDILVKHYSVRQVEDLVRDLQERNSQGSPTTKPKENQKDPALLKIEDELSSHLSTRVLIKPKKGNKGELVISYYSTDDLNRILEILNK
ncbi:MAG: ParB/RepB/Spo0J family partition protein [Bacteroidetes bacterium]|nr:ParB/RepB/Spo0J family partition protein [Bacteroidota bacterium]